MLDAAGMRHYSVVNLDSLVMAPFAETSTYDGSLTRPPCSEVVLLSRLCCGTFQAQRSNKLENTAKWLAKSRIIKRCKSWTVGNLRVTRQRAAQSFRNEASKYFPTSSICISVISLSEVFTAQPYLFDRLERNFAGHDAAILEYSRIKFLHLHPSGRIVVRIIWPSSAKNGVQKIVKFMHSSWNKQVDRQLC